MYYGQNHEDALAWALLTEPHGIYVDVGAHDGVLFSNTYHFYKRGWSGICIEPHPLYNAALRVNRPDDICLQIALDKHSADNVPFSGTPIGAFSGLRLSDEMRRLAAVETMLGGNQWHGFDEYLVNVRTLSTVLEQFEHHQVDLLTVDVEGIEADVLRGLDFTRWQPRLIIAEENDAADLRAVLYGAGYVHALSAAQNGFYTYTIEDAELLRAARLTL